MPTCFSKCNLHVYMLCDIVNCMYIGESNALSICQCLRFNDDGLMMTDANVLHSISVRSHSHIEVQFRNFYLRLRYEITDDTVPDVRVLSYLHEAAFCLILLPRNQLHR